MNFGTISAPPQGTIIMASGQSVLIGEEGGHVYAQVDTAKATGVGPEGGEGTAATQKARFGAGDTFAVAVFNKGVAKAKRVQMETSRGRDGRVGHDRRLRHLRGREGRLGRDPR
jgi:hypothetical protein